MIKYDIINVLSFFSEPEMHSTAYIEGGERTPLRSGPAPHGYGAVWTIFN